MRSRFKKGAIFLASAAFIAAAVSYLAFRQQHPSEIGPSGAGAVADRKEIASTVHLYFGDRGNDYLTAETRLLVHEPGPATLGRAIVTALISGPRTDRLRTVSEQTQLRAFYVTDDATAYVDLTEAVSENHPGGASAELMSVYSIVNSLILNIPEIQRVKILLAGSEATTLAGHIDLRHPLAANMLILR